MARNEQLKKANAIYKATKTAKKKVDVLDLSFSNPFQAEKWTPIPSTVLSLDLASPEGKAVLERAYQYDESPSDFDCMSYFCQPGLSVNNSNRTDK